MERPGARTSKLSSSVWELGPRTTGLLWEGMSVRATVLATDCNEITEVYILCVTIYTRTRDSINKHSYT